MGRVVSFSLATVIGVVLEHLELTPTGRSMVRSAACDTLSYDEVGVLLWYSEFTYPLLLPRYQSSYFIQDHDGQTTFLRRIGIFEDRVIASQARSTGYI